MQWYLKVLRQYADFTGRARRTEYWLFVLFNAIISIVLQIADYGLGLQIGDSGFGNGYGVLGTIYGLAVLVPGLAVAARRLHDIDRSGWWQVLPYALFVPMFVAIPLMISTASTSQPPLPLIVAFVVFGLAAIAASIVLLVWAVTDGKPGPNRFGPNPKEPVPAPVG